MEVVHSKINERITHGTLMTLEEVVLIYPRSIIGDNIHKYILATRGS